MLPEGKGPPFSDSHSPHVGFVLLDSATKTAGGQKCKSYSNMIEAHVKSVSTRWSVHEINLWTV